MLKITVVDEIQERRETKNSVLYNQKAYVYLNGEPFPKEIKTVQWVDKKTGEVPPAFKKGEYTLSMDSFSVGRYGDIECRPILIPSTSNKSS